MPSVIKHLATRSLAARRAGN